MSDFILFSINSDSSYLAVKGFFTVTFSTVPMLIAIVSVFILKKLSKVWKIARAEVARKKAEKDDAALLGVVAPKPGAFDRDEFGRWKDPFLDNFDDPKS